MGQTKTAGTLEAYNVVWDAPSKNSSESMPCGGGDIGLNVRVEGDGKVLFYMQRSGSLAETNESLREVPRWSECCCQILPLRQRRMSRI